MKIEVRCPSCGKGYLVDEARIPPGGGSVPCQACGAAIALKSSSPRAVVPPPVEPPRTAPPPSTEALAAVPAAARDGEVCCPRCGLHFVPSAQADGTGDRRTLLLVEDLEYFVDIARDALAGRYELKTARTVDEARGIIVKGGVDLLLLDVTLAGGEDGLRLLREPPGKVCPVLLFTAQDESEMYGDGWEQLRKVGVDDVVMKGINMGELLVRKVAILLGEPSTTDKILR